MYKLLLIVITASVVTLAVLAITQEQRACAVRDSLNELQQRAVFAAVSEAL